MKKALFILALSTPGFTALAQDKIAITGGSAYPKNEAGVFFQTNLTGTENNININMGGVQYTHWITPHLGFRLLGAYGSYTDKSATTTYIPNRDTIITQQRHTKINMPVIGGGLIAQRQFYKHIYLFAGLEIKGSYGTGHADTVVRTTTYDGPSTGNETYSEENRTGTGARLLMINATATIGAKLEFTRFSLGLELLPVQMGYQHISYSNNSSGIADFNIGNFSQRIFLNYRFR